MNRKPETKPVDAARRGFLRKAGLASGAAAAAVATPALAQPAAEPASQPETQRGYRETEHVRAYYDKARI